MQRNKLGQFEDGIIPLNKDKQLQKKWNISKEFLVEEHINKEKSIRQIAREIKTPHRTLTTYFHSFNIPIRKEVWNKGREKKNKWNISKEFLVEEYINKKKTIRQISKENNIPNRTLTKYFHKFDIKIEKRVIGFKRGNKPWNAGTRGVVITWNKGKKLHYEVWNKNKKGLVKGWNKGLTKATDERVKKNAESVKKTHWMNKLSKEEKSKITREMRMSQNFPKKYTTIERMIFRGLEENNILFTPHKFVLGITEADAFIEPNIIIYCDGDYWHCNPNKYNKDEADQNQREHIERDNRNNKLLRENGYIVLRFWETNIKQNLPLCISQIKGVIK